MYLRFFFFNLQQNRMVIWTEKTGTKNCNVWRAKVVLQGSICVSDMRNDTLVSETHTWYIKFDRIQSVDKSYIQMHIHSPHTHTKKGFFCLFCYRKQQQKQWLFVDVQDGLSNGLLHTQKQRGFSGFAVYYYYCRAIEQLTRLPCFNLLFRFSLLQFY